MRQSIVALSFLASAALAQTTTVEFFFPGGYDGVEPVASIVDVKASTTVMALGCPTGVDSTECGWGPMGLITYSLISQTSYVATMSDESFVMSFDCSQNTQKKEMACTAEMSGLEYSEGPTTESATLTGGEISFIAATVTEGAELLGATATPNAVSASATSSLVTSVRQAGTAGATSAPTGSGATATASGASASGSGAAPESTGAAARFGLDGSALLALAGAAALNVF